MKELLYVEPTNWNVTVEESDEEMDSDEIEDDDEEMSDEDDSMSIVTDTPSLATSISTAPTESTITPESPIAEEPDLPPTSKDTLPFPRPFESRAQFFARTSQDWQNIIIVKQSYGGAAQVAATMTEQSIKELRKKAFEMAEERWWDCREEVTRLEDEMEEGGVGEIVDMAERGGEAGGVGRRR